MFSTFLLLSPMPPVLLFHSEVKVFTLSGSHQRCQPRLCESFSCCTSLTFFFKNWRNPPKITDNSDNPSQTRYSKILLPNAHCLAADGHSDVRKERVGRVFLVWPALSSLCVVMGDSGRLQLQTEAEGETWVEDLALPLSLSPPPLTHFLLDLALHLQPSARPNLNQSLRPSIHPSLFPPPPELPLSHRQTQLPSWTFPFCRPAPTKVLSHVKPNLQPPKTRPLTPSVFTPPEGEGSWSRKGRLLGKGQIPKDTFVYARVCVRADACVHALGLFVFQDKHVRLILWIRTNTHEGKFSCGPVLLRLTAFQVVSVCMASECVLYSRDILAPVCEKALLALKRRCPQTKHRLCFLARADLQVLSGQSSPPSTL